MHRSTWFCGPTQDYFECRLGHCLSLLLFHHGEDSWYYCSLVDDVYPEIVCTSRNENLVHQTAGLCIMFTVRFGGCVTGTTTNEQQDSHRTVTTTWERTDGEIPPLLTVWHELFSARQRKKINREQRKRVWQHKHDCPWVVIHCQWDRNRHDESTRATHRNGTWANRTQRLFTF